MSDLDALADEAAELDGYFSDTPLDPQPNYPDLDESMDAAIVVSNLPKVPAAKVEKLTKVVMKLLSRIGNLHETEDFGGFLMPTDEEGNTLGFCFVEYDSPESALKAVEVLQGYSFDKNHTLHVTQYPRAKELATLESAEFKEPDLPPFQEKPNALEWLEDPNQRDAFVVRHGKETIVRWFDAQTEPTIDYDGSREKEAGVQWCEYYCHWSPAGSFLATLVPAKGVILWSGKNYEKTARFIAKGVRMVNFSPQENYILCSNEDPNDPGAVKIYHIPTGKLLRQFPLYPEKVSKDGPPPPFLWSHDDKYIARMGENLISIYDAPSMRLLDKRSLSAEGICEFQWSPHDNVLAYWAPEANNTPAHVDLIQIPSRKKLRQKNLFNVTKCNMVWHPQGDFLAVKVTRHTKSKKTLYNNIELFRVSEMGVPVEMLDTKDAVLALSWEPRGSRFAMIHAENPSASKVSVSFYDMTKTTEVTVKGKKRQQLSKELNLLETLQNKQCNCLFWSPAGNNIILASLGDAASGTLEFYDVDNKSLTVKEHYRANQVIWDPAGRSVASVVSQPIEGGHFKFAMDNGYILWSFQGKQLYQQSFESFYQFAWRPRESLLTKKEINDVKKNIKKYEKRFDRADKERQRRKYLEETKGKRDERSQFRDLLARNRTIFAKQRAEYIALLGGYDSEDESNYVMREVAVEKVLNTKEEIVM